MNFRQVAMNLIARNSNLANNPQAQQLVDIIRRNDSAAGEQMARDICSQAGVSYEEAQKQALKFFGLG